MLQVSAALLVKPLYLIRDIVALQPLLLMQVFMPHAALYATNAATTAAAQSHELRVTSCLLFHFTLICLESNSVPKAE